MTVLLICVFYPSIFHSSFSCLFQFLALFSLLLFPILQSIFVNAPSLLKPFLHPFFQLFFTTLQFTSLFCDVSTARKLLACGVFCGVKKGRKLGVDTKTLDSLHHEWARKQVEETTHAACSLHQQHVSEGQEEEFPCPYSALIVSRSMPKRIQIFNHLRTM